VVAVVVKIKQAEMAVQAVAVDIATKPQELERHHQSKEIMVLLVQRLVHLFPQAVVAVQVQQVEEI
jgi:hypothetical protein